MRTSRFLRTTLLFASTACLSLVPAWAASIAVNNPSFETLPPGGLPFPCGTNCSYSSDTVPGWTGGSGQFQPGPPATTSYFNYVPDGITVAYGGPTLSQIVGQTIQSGLTYTFTVDLGSRNDTGFASAAGVQVGSVFYAATGTVPSAGDWSTYTATFVGTNANAGNTIELELITTGAQGDFDDVTLSDSGTAVPEPSSIALLGTGLLGLAGVTRRKFFS